MVSVRGPYRGERQFWSQPARGFTASEHDP